MNKLLPRDTQLEESNKNLVKQIDIKFRNDVLQIIKEFPQYSKTGNVSNTCISVI